MLELVGSTLGRQKMQPTVLLAETKKNVTCQYCLKLLAILFAL